MENEVPDIGNDEARVLYAYIYRTLVNISGSWIIFKQLFVSGIDNLNLMGHVASNTFGTIQWSMYESIILGIAKLTDPARFGTHENLSILRLQELLISTRPADADAILAKWNSNSSRFEPLRKKRNKQVAHADKIFAFEPPCTVPEIEDALAGTIDVMRSIDKVFMQSYTLWEEPVQQGDGDDLLYVLRYWKASRCRAMRGMFKYFDLSKYEMDPFIADKLSRTNMGGGQSVAADLAYQVYGYIEGDMREPKIKK